MIYLVNILLLVIQVRKIFLNYFGLSSNKLSEVNQILSSAFLKRIAFGSNVLIDQKLHIQILRVLGGSVLHGIYHIF